MNNIPDELIVALSQPRKGESPGDAGRRNRTGGCSPGKKGTSKALGMVAATVLLVSAFAPRVCAAANPEDAQKHIIAGANAAKENDWQAALQEFLSAAAIDEHSEKALYHVGVAYYHLGRLDQARIAELLAIQANPRFMPAFLELATIEPSAANILKRS